MSVDLEALKERTDIVTVVGSYIGLIKQAGEYRGLCPFHEDHNPSFYVIPQKRFAHCFGCGWSGDVIDFLMEQESLTFSQALERLGAQQAWQPKPASHYGKTDKQLAERVTSKPPAGTPAPDMKLKELGAPSATWEYRDADGAPLGYVARYQNGSGKEIRCWSWGQREPGHARWGCGHFSKPRYLYGLDRLAARPSAPVLVVEGEKTCDAAHALLGEHYVAITWPGGAKAWKFAEWAPLKGRSVLLWPDADEAGRQCMEQLAGLLADPRGLGCTVKILTPSDVPEGWDLADALGEAWSTDQTIHWAKPRAKPFINKANELKNPAPQVASPLAGNSGSLRPPQAPEPADAGPPEGLEPPESDLLPIECYTQDGAQNAPERAQKRSRGHLSLVDGNAARKPDPNDFPLPAAMSEDALAEHFVAEYGQNWRYAPEQGVWLEWRGDSWHRDRLNAVTDLFRTITRQSLEWPEASQLTPAARQKLSSKRTAWNARDMAAVDKRVAILADALDSDAMLLGVPGGVVDLREGKLVEPQRDQYITRRCSVAPAEGPHPLFDRVLERACRGSAEVRAYLLRWFGYMLTGSVAEESFMFLHGPGGSGKSTLIKALSEVMGDYASAISMEAFTETKQERHSQEIAKLEGTRFVYASETDEGRRFKDSLIKWLTGGDRIVARRMRMEDREFRPTFKILLYGNSIPHLKSVGEEMRRRIHLIEYAGSIELEERDSTLKDRIVEEYPAILHTLIRGCLDWQQCSGLGKPEAIVDSVDQYLEGEDDMLAFLEDCIERDVPSRELSGDVYRRYAAWARNSGTYVYSQKRLVQMLKSRGFEQSRANGKRYIKGLKLRPESVAEASVPYYAQER